MRSKRLVRTKYDFARKRHIAYDWIRLWTKATYALEAAYPYKVRLLRVRDLSLRVWLSDLKDDSEDCDRV